MMFGGLNFKDFDFENAPAEARKAWSELPALTGATFKPVKYITDQVGKGVYYWFIALETRTTYPITQRYVLLAVSSFEGKSAIVEKSIHELPFLV